MKITKVQLPRPQKMSPAEERLVWLNENALNDDLNRLAASVDTLEKNAGSSAELEQVKANVAQLRTDADALRSTIVNPNLLDNWYLMGGGSQQSGKDALPINQRGATTYSSAGYCIDRWRIDTGITVTVNSGYVQFKNTSATTCYVRQRFPFNEPWPFYKKVTGSILFVDGTLLSGTVYPNTTTQTSNYQNWTFFTASWGSFFIEIAPSGNSIYQIIFSLYAGKTVQISAIKAEIGDHQTLAYYDQAAGIWKPREIPSFDEQMLRCLYYYQAFSAYQSAGFVTTSGTQYIIPIYLNAPIHKSATMTSGTVTARKGSGGYSPGYPSGGANLKSPVLSRRSPALYQITDTWSTAPGDTNNSVLFFSFNNLVLKYDL